jgi:hypothetical protein
MEKASKSDVVAGDRYSVAEAPQVLTDSDEIARREAENGIR